MRPDPQPLAQLAAQIEVTVARLHRIGDQLRVAASSSAATTWHGSAGDAHRAANHRLSTAVADLTADCDAAVRLCRSLAARVTVLAGTLHHLEHGFRGLLGSLPVTVLQKLSRPFDGGESVVVTTASGLLHVHLPGPGALDWQDLAGLARGEGYLL